MRSSRKRLRSRSSIALLLLLYALCGHLGVHWPCALAELPLSAAEQQHVHKVVWRKSMAAIAEGKMRPGKELDSWAGIMGLWNIYI